MNSVVFLEGRENTESQEGRRKGCNLALTPALSLPELQEYISQLDQARMDEVKARSSLLGNEASLHGEGEMKSLWA